MTRLERVAVWGSTLVTTATGVGFFWTKYLLQSDEPWAVVNHPLQPWLLKAHIISAPFLIFAIGMIMLRHVWRHLQSGTRWGRRSGIIAGVALAPMIVTGYLVQVVTQQGWLAVFAWTHTGFGIVYALAAALHWPALRRMRREGRSGTGNAPRPLGRAPREARTRQPA